MCNMRYFNHINRDLQLPYYCLKNDDKLSLTIDEGIAVTRPLSADELTLILAISRFGGLISAELMYAQLQLTGEAEEMDMHAMLSTLKGLVKDHMVLEHEILGDSKPTVVYTLHRAAKFMNTHSDKGTFAPYVLDLIEKPKTALQLLQYLNAQALVLNLINAGFVIQDARIPHCQVTDYESGAVVRTHAKVSMNGVTILYEACSRSGSNWQEEVSNKLLRYERCYGNQLQPVLLLLSGQDESMLSELNEIACNTGLSIHTLFFKEASLAEGLKNNLVCFDSRKNCVEVLLTA